MVSGLLGIKKGQSQTFTPNGERIPVTHIQAGPCWVVGVSEYPTFRSVQLGFCIAKTIRKPLMGHIKKAGLEKKPRFLRSFRLREGSDVSLGKEVNVGDVFQPGEKVRVTGISKGKGFAGVVKRHGFAGGPRTHGQSDRERAPGSIGQTTTPGRVYRGKRMAGRMGGKRVTVTGLTVVAVNPQKNTLTVKGVVPGARSRLLVISKERTKRNVKS